MLETIKEVFIAQHRVDFRRGVFGMRAEMTKMDLDPYAGDCCVFIHPNQRQLRVIGGSSTGCWMIVKIFDAGALKKTFRFMQDPAFVQISKLELSLLLEGATVTEYAKVPVWYLAIFLSLTYGQTMSKKSREKKKEPEGQPVSIEQIYAAEEWFRNNQENLPADVRACLKLLLDSALKGKQNRAAALASFQQLLIA